LERCQEHPEKITCPSCHTDCQLGPAGVAGLLADYGVSGISDSQLDGAYCTGCKSRESSAVARCFDCSNFLCANCVMAHQFMHCFEGHHVTTLGEITSNSGGHHVQELDAVNKLISDGKLKANEIRNNLKNLETTSTRLSSQYQKSLGEVNETFQFYVSMLEERKAEIARELEQAYSSKQVALSVYSQKAQETVDKIFQVTDFVERLMKHASNGEVLMFKKPLDARLHQLLTYTPELNLATLTELEFISNFQAIQVGVKNQFGYVKSKPESGNGNKQQPPISRPVSGSSQQVGSPLPTQQIEPQMPSLPNIPPSNSMTNPMMQTMVRGLLDQRSLYHSNQMESGSALSASNLLAGKYCRTVTPQNMNSGFPSNSQLTSLLSGSSIADLANSSGLNPYEKWSNGSDSLFGGLTGPNSQPDAFKERIGLGHQSSNDSMMDLSSKFMSQTSLSSPPMPQGAPLSSTPLNTALYPPKSQIKRQKMIYHCKFGEFGILEGQFTEPSGVAVNAQNDIIVADTNNHRIQIFDKEGRFKFQFGEVGKRDGQLLYPNRVAVVKTSGDIIVTERSPTHQIQIYNQYGQFVRKFGANILQHPRGVCVDSKGRIIVVECKVMRVIIFDQMGNVLNKFGCSKHLEFPNGVVVNDRQEIFISDNRAHCVKVFDYEGNFLRQIGGEGITNYPIGVGINAAGEITIADNHNNFNLSVFSQDGQLISALESKVKHAQCFDVALMDDGSVVLASKDYRLYIYRYIQVPPIGL
jgi:tripartite motif-containing protein 2/3